MAKRLMMAALFALVACAMTFYLAYFAGLIYRAATGPLNPANDPALQAGLRHIALPVSIGLAVATFVLTFWRSGKRIPRQPAKVISIR